MRGDRPTPLWLLAALTGLAPLSVDAYLPLLPQVSADLGISPAQVQLSVSLCLVGLALGQAAAGPLSDRWGRRRPLIFGLAAFTVSSAFCACAGTGSALLLGRAARGAAGAVGVVIAVQALIAAGAGFVVWRRRQPALGRVWAGSGRGAPPDIRARASRLPC